MSTLKIELGKPPTESSPTRDAIHIAVFKAIAGEPMVRGQWVVISENTAFPADGSVAGIGIVDPFGPALVSRNAPVWICMKPGSVTDLRHTWDHPHLPAEAAEDDDDPYYDGCSGC